MRKIAINLETQKRNASRSLPVKFIISQNVHSFRGFQRLLWGGGVPPKGGFSFSKRRGRKISSGVQAAPLSELWQGLGVRLRHKIRGVKLGGVEHFIRGLERF
jgi:hypothetical protein